MGNCLFFANKNSFSPVAIVSSETCAFHTQSAPREYKILQPSISIFSTFYSNFFARAHSCRQVLLLWHTLTHTHTHTHNHAYTHICYLYNYVLATNLIPSPSIYYRRLFPFQYLYIVFSFPIFRCIFFLFKYNIGYRCSIVLLLY